MTTYQGVAAVSQTLRYLVETAARAVAPEAATTIESPQRLAAASQDEPRISVYLLQAVPDPVLRSQDLPMRSPAGEIVSSPRVAVNLRYILTFFGPPAVGQLMFGSVEIALRERPFLDPAIVTDAMLDHPNLQGSQLERQSPPVMLSPLPWDLEQFSRMWSSFFQLPYRLATLYEASGLVLESSLPSLVSLPVRSVDVEIEETARALDPLPTVDWSPDAWVNVSGRGLRADDALSVGGRETRLFWTGDQLAFRLPDGTRAGVVNVQPLVGKGNALGQAQTLVIRPRLDSVEFDPASRQVVATVDPAPGPSQVVALSLVSLEPADDALSSVRIEAVDAPDGRTIRFVLPTIPPGPYVTMIEVDGVSSIPAFERGRYAEPRVELP